MHISYADGRGDLGRVQWPDNGICDNGVPVRGRDLSRYLPHFRERATRDDYRIAQGAGHET